MGQLKGGHRKRPLVTPTFDTGLTGARVAHLSSPSLPPPSLPQIVRPSLPSISLSIVASLPTSLMTPRQAKPIVTVKRSVVFEAGGQGGKRAAHVAPRGLYSTACGGSRSLLSFSTISLCLRPPSADVLLSRLAKGADTDISPSVARLDGSSCGRERGRQTEIALQGMRGR